MRVLYYCKAIIYMNKRCSIKNKTIKRREYALNMKKASKDKEFMKRTNACQKDFDNIDIKINRK